MNNMEHVMQFELSYYVLDRLHFVRLNYLAPMCVLEDRCSRIQIHTQHLFLTDKSEYHAEHG